MRIATVLTLGLIAVFIVCMLSRELFLQHRIGKGWAGLKSGLYAVRRRAAVDLISEGEGAAKFALIVEDVAHRVELLRYGDNMSAMGSYEVEIDADAFLCQWALRNSDWQVSEGLLEYIRNILAAESRCDEMVRVYLRSGSFHVRAACVYLVLASEPSEYLFRIVTESAICDVDGYIRGLGLYFMGRRRSVPNDFDRIAALSKGDSDLWVRRTAVWMLGQSGCSKRCVDALASFCRDRSVSVRAGAAMSLANCWLEFGNIVSDELERLTRDEDGRVRKVAKDLLVTQAISPFSQEARSVPR